MINRKLNIILVLTLIIISTTNVRLQAYSDDEGLQIGDVIEVNFDAKILGGSRDGEVAIPNEISILELTPAAMISGFYEALLGMKINEVKNNIIIPPEKGYTSVSHELYNQTLNYNIQVLRLIHNNNFSSLSTQENKSALFDNFIFYTEVMLVLFVLSYLLILTRQRFRKFNRVMCTFCNNIADGKCGQCGTMSCRASFSSGCLNCKSNTFVGVNIMRK